MVVGHRAMVDDTMQSFVGYQARFSRRVVEEGRQH